MSTGLIRQTARATARFGRIVVAASGVVLVACSTVACVPVSRSPAECPIADCPAVQSTKMDLPGGPNDAFFGLSISLNGRLMGVGSVSDDHAGQLSGAAYIFRQEGDSWVMEAKLTASDAAAQDYFGEISISGDRAVVGAPTCLCAEGRPAGAAYVFRRTGGEWKEEAKLVVTDVEQPHDFFGNAVSLSGDRLVVAARSDYHDEAGSGAVYVFRREGTEWVREAKLVSDGGGSDDFGFSVSIHGDFVAVGAVCDEVAGVSGFCVGSVYVFEREETEWTQRAKLSALDARDRDYFGGSVFLNGDDLIIGADRASGGGVGRAYIYHRSGATWEEEAILEPDVDESGGSFGHSVAIDDGTALVGAAFAAGGPDRERRGAIYVFQRDGREWHKSTKIFAADEMEGDIFGESVALHGNVAVAGAIVADGVSGAGGIHVFDICTLNCVP